MSLNALSGELSGALGVALGELFERLDKVEKSQARLEMSAAASAEAFESSFAAMLVRSAPSTQPDVQTTAAVVKDEAAASTTNAPAPDTMAAPLSDDAALAAAGTAPPAAADKRTKGGWGAARRLGGVPKRPSIIADVALEARRVAAAKREEGALMAEWTAMVEQRLTSLEAAVGDMQASVRALEEDGAGGGRTALEATRQELETRTSQQVAEEAAAIRLEVREALRASETVASRCEAELTTLQSDVDASKEDAARAAARAEEASKRVAVLSAPGLDLSKVKERLNECLGELGRVRSTKCDKAVVEGVRAELLAHNGASLAALEARLLSVSTGKAHALVDDVKDSLAPLQAHLEREGPLREQIASIDAKLARKLDASTLYAAILPPSTAGGAAEADAQSGQMVSQLVSRLLLSGAVVGTNGGSAHHGAPGGGDKAAAEQTAERLRELQASMGQLLTLVKHSHSPTSPQEAREHRQPHAHEPGHGGVGGHGGRGGIGRPSSAHAALPGSRRNLHHGPPPPPPVTNGLASSSHGAGPSSGYLLHSSGAHGSAPHGLDRARHRLPG